MSRPLRIRPAVRAVITDPEWRTLLVHFDFPHTESLPNGLWACPGGGIDPEESPEAALRRELLEELGYDLEAGQPALGEPVWRKEHVFAMQRWDGQRDSYFWIQVEPFEPRPRMTADELRAENVDGMRWWSYDELQTAQSGYDADDPERPAGVVLSPRRLGHLVADLRSEGRPSSTRVLDPL